MRALTGRRGFLVAIATLSLATVACDQSARRTSDAIESSTAVTFEAGGVELSGRLFGPEDAPVGVVLAHMLPADQSAWYVTAGRLADQGYRVLTFDFRGFCPGGDAGCSEGELDVDAAPVDLAAALDYLRSQGVSRAGLVGASMGGTAALVVAAGEGDDVGAVVTLSAPEGIEGLTAGPEVLQRVNGAKLFVAGTGDATAAAAAETFFDESLQPKRVEIVTSDDHGTDLLTGNQGERVYGLLEGWLLAHVPPEGQDEGVDE
ncbi:MAG TPA: alpha/beta fold hydrolase [Actinomycetota bacterium]